MHHFAVSEEEHVLNLCRHSKNNSTSNRKLHELNPITFKMHDYTLKIFLINVTKNQLQASTTHKKYNKIKNESQACCDRRVQRPALIGSCQQQEMTSRARSQRTHAALEHFGRPVPLICLLSASDKLSSHGMTLQRSYDLSDPGWLSSADCSGGDE